MNKMNISDELLARFLDNKTTSEEDEMVLFSLQDDENFQEYLDIRNAKLLVDDDSFSCDETDARKFVERTLLENEEKHSPSEDVSDKKKRIFWITSIAAGLIILLSIFNPFGTKNADNKKMANLDSMQKYQVEIREQVFAQMAQANFFEIVKPSETINVNKDADSIVFKWNTNAEKVIIHILDENQKTLFKSDTIKTLNTIAVSSKVLLSDTTLYWIANLFFENGENDVKKGMIKVDNKNY